MSFATGLQKSIGQVEKLIVSSHKAAAGKAHITAIRAAPVDTGFFHNRFKIAVDEEPPSEEEEGYDIKKTWGAAPLQIAEIKKVKVGSESINYNNVSYGPLLEEGTVKMAPRPTMKKAGISANIILKRSISSTRNKKIGE